MIRVRYEVEPTTVPAILDLPTDWIVHRKGGHSDWDPVPSFRDFSDWTYVFSSLLSHREARLHNQGYLKGGGDAEAASRIGAFIGDPGRELDLFIVVAIGTEL